MTVQLISFTPEQKDLQITDYEGRVAALQAAQKVIETKLAYLAEEEDGQPNGIRLSLVERHTEDPVGLGVGEPTSSQVTELHNALAEKSVARFATRGAAVEKTTKVLSQVVKQRSMEGPMTKGLREGDLASVKTNRGRKARFQAAQKLVFLLKENPYNPAKKNYARVKAIMDSATVGEALDRGATLADIACLVDRDQLRVD